MLAALGEAPERADAGIRHDKLEPAGLDSEKSDPTRQSLGMVNDIADQLAEGCDQQWSGLAEPSGQRRFVRVNLETCERVLPLQSSSRDQPLTPLFCQPLTRFGGERSQKRLERAVVEPSLGNEAF